MDLYRNISRFNLSKLKVICSTLIGVFILSCSTTCSGQNNDEHYVKSSYILNFIEETTWPNENEIDTFYIAVLGSTKIYNNLDNLSKDLDVKNKPFKVNYYSTPSEVTNEPQVIFISPRLHSKIGELNTSLNNTLIITDSDNVDQKAMIYFFVNNEDKIQFKLNLKAFKKAKLSPSAKLLLYGGEKEEVFGIMEQSEKTQQNQLEKLQERDQLINEKEQLIIQLAQSIKSKENNIERLMQNVLTRKIEAQEYEQLSDSLHKSIVKEKKLVEDALAELKNIEDQNKQKQDTLSYYQNLLQIKIADIYKNNEILEQQKQQIDLQNKDLSQLDIQLQKSQQGLLAALTGVLLILIIAFFLYREIKTKKKTLGIIENQNQRILEASIYKDEFIANLSHEVRTPLNAITGYTNLLLSKYSDSRYKSFLQKILLSSNNLLAIINDILDLSKIEAGKIEFESINFDFPLVIKNTFESLKITAESKQLEYKLDYDLKLPHYISSDPTRINQVLLNLLSNAIKFTEKGIVVLQITLVNSDKDSSSILFTVKDSGKGINKNKLHLIFESFTQEDASTTRKYGGTGLGLTISQKIINLMGSKIQVKSILNKGSEFSFILNLKNSQTSSILNNEDNHVEIDEIETKKIVIADDEQMNRDLLIEQFKHWNPQLTIDFAIDGKELVNLVAKNSYDIILTDVRMPKLSGIDATIQIKNINPSIVIIGVSANAIDHDIKECLDAGMNDYVTKPINFNQLLIKIAKHLNLKYRVIKNETSSFNNKYFAKVRDISENKQEHKETVVNLTSEIDEIIKNLTAKTDYPIAHSLLNKVIYVNDPKLLNICRTYESAVKNKSSEVQENIEVIKTYWIELLPVIL